MAIKWLIASSSQGTVLKKIGIKHKDLIYGVLTDRDCGAREFAFENDLKHFSFLDWKSIPKNVPILLLGFKKILSPEEIEGRKIINVHPSFLPLHSGWNEDVHQSVLESEQKISAVTLHEVNEDLDSGKIIRQFPFPVFENDDVKKLKDRCQQVETFVCSELINNKNTNVWWDQCAEYLDL